MTATKNTLKEDTKNLTWKIENNKPENSPNCSYSTRPISNYSGDFSTIQTVKLNQHELSTVGSCWMKLPLFTLFSFPFLSVSTDDSHSVQEKTIKMINIGLNLHLESELNPTMTLFCTRSIYFMKVSQRNSKQYLCALKNLKNHQSTYQLKILKGKI